MAATNVQAFPGDVQISSNLVVDTNTLFVDSVGGAVGIGTTAPESLLHLSASTASADITDPIKIKIHNRRGAGDWSITQPWGLLEFDTNDTSTAGTGPVAGIGCRFEQAGGGDSSICFYTDNSGNDDNVLGAANERMCIDSDGNVGIGTDNPTSNLHVVGDIYSTGNVTAYSDKRAKENIEKIENALDKVCTLGGYTYTMKGQKYTGLIAQEVLEVLPEAVTGSEETNYALAYGNMMGLIVEAIKELKEKIG